MPPTGNTIISSATLTSASVDSRSTLAVTESAYPASLRAAEALDADATDASVGAVDKERKSDRNLSNNRPTGGSVYAGPSKTVEYRLRFS
jgi:hypothetical protein